MFNADALTLRAVSVADEPELVIVPVDAEHGVLAVVKPLGGGKAACIAFSPATRLDNPFKGYRPTFLRKVVTTDLPLREGRWKPVSIEGPSALTLRSAVVALFKDFTPATMAAAKTIEMHRPTNVSSSPEVSNAVYAAPESVAFEKALGHLVALEFTLARAIAKTQAELAARVAAEATRRVVEDVPAPARQESVAAEAVAPETAAAETSPAHANASSEPAA